MTATDSPSLVHDPHIHQSTTTPNPHGLATTEDQPCADTKGKAPTKPVPIRPSTVRRDLFDVGVGVDVAGSSSTCKSISPTTPASSHISPMFPYASFDDPDFTTVDPVLVQDLYNDAQVPFSSLSASSKGKGKGKDIPPCLPPLSFSNMAIDCNQQSSWPPFGSVSSTPYSYDPTSSPPEVTGAPASPQEMYTARSPTTSTESIWAGASASGIPSRHYSLSNLKPTPSLASLTMSKIKVKLGPSTTTQSNLAKILLHSKRGDTAPDAAAAAASSETVLHTAAGGASVPNLPTLDPSVAPWYAAPLQYDLDNLLPSTFVRPRAGTVPNSKLHPSRMMLKTKGRSKSSPLPFSALDYVPATSTDIFKPIPLFRRNYIDQILPKELQIHILKCVVRLFEEDHIKVVTEGRWTISKAVSSRYQLVGRDRGVRELFKLARVRHIKKQLSLTYLFTSI